MKIKKKIAIIGSGFAGIAAGYQLSYEGHNVTIFEKDEVPGGLASTFTVKGQKLEKFYHHWLGTDHHIFDLINEIGKKDKLKFFESKVGIYFANKNYKFSSPIDLLFFTPLPFFSRIRFGLAVIYSWFIKNPKYLEQITAEDWLIQVAGKKAYKIIWEPLLIGKFGKQFYKDVAAIWIWNKLIQRGKSRDANAKEKLAYYEGGFNSFINDLLEILIKQKVKILYNHKITKLKPYEKTISLLTNKKWEKFDNIIFTGHTQN